jgi:hypothetical protein
MKMVHTLISKYALTSLSACFLLYIYPHNNPYSLSPQFGRFKPQLKSYSCGHIHIPIYLSFFFVTKQILYSHLPVTTKFIYLFLFNLFIYSINTT